MPPTVAQRYGSVRFGPDDRARELEALHDMAISFRDLGQLEEAERHKRRAIEFAHQAGSAQVLAMARVGRAEPPA